MKESIWACYENFITIIQAFILVRFITSIYGVKYWKKHPMITCAIGTVIYAIFVILTNYIVGFEGFGIVFFVVVMSLYGIFWLEGRWHGKIPLVMMEDLVIIFANTIVSLLICIVTGIDGTKLANTPCMERFFALIIAQTVLFVCLEAIGKVLKREWGPLTKNEGKIFGFIFFSSIIIFFCITQTLFTQELSGSNKARLLGASIGLVLLNILCFHMLNNLVRKREVETENLLLKEQNMYQEKYAKEVKTQYDEMKRMRHDMRQHYSVLENLLVEKKYDKMEEYLLKSIQNINNRDNFFYMKNEYVNAILNRKISQAKEAGILVTLNSIQEFLGADEMDICNLLGNLLDNAMEACEKVQEEKSIDIILFQDTDKIYVEMKNSIAAPVLKDNKLFVTEKKNKEEHGFGIKTIREIVEKYEGLIDFSEELGKFCVNLVLYVPNNTKLP